MWEGRTKLWDLSWHGDTRFFFCFPNQQQYRGGVPRRTVRFSLPGVTNIREPFTLRVPVPVEIVVPGTELGVGVGEKILRLRLIFGMPVDVEGGRGVKGRLDHARGLVVLGGVGALFSVPEIRARKIVRQPSRVQNTPLLALRSPSLKTARTE